MSDNYVRSIEEENEKLRQRIVIAEEETERVWEILDEIKTKIKDSPSFSIASDFDEQNMDRSGQICMMKIKDIRKFKEDLAKIEDFYKEIVGIIEES